MIREKTYPYTPLRLLYQHMGKPGETHTVWLTVFLLRLGAIPHMNVKVADIKEFVKRNER